MDWNVNFIWVLVAAIANMILGMLWYGPFFGEEWMKIIGISGKDIRKGKQNTMWKEYLGQFIATLVTVYILALSFKYLSPTSIYSAITIGLLIWIGFIAAINVGVLLWQKDKSKLYIIDMSYRLVSMIITSIILFLTK